MISAVNQGSSPSFFANTRLGTQVLYQWAKWQKQHAYPQPIQAVVFRKEDARLVVYEYGRALCIAIKRVDSGPKMRNFREWRQPYVTVKAKLIQRGWVLDSQHEEVSHVAH